MTETQKAGAKHEFRIEISQRYGDDYPLSRTVTAYAVAVKIYEGWLFYINDGRIDDGIAVVRLAGRESEGMWTILATSGEPLSVGEAVPGFAEMEKRISDQMGMFSK